MLNLRKIEKELIEIETKIEKANFTELKELVRRCNQNTNKLNRKKQRATKEELVSLNDTLKQIKTLKQKIVETIREKEETDFIEINYETKKIRTEEQELNAIRNSEQPEETKRNQIKEFITITEAKIEYYLEQNKKLILTKRNEGIYLTAARNYDIEKQIRSNEKEIKYQRFILQKCQGILVTLRPKKKKSSVSKEKIQKNRKTKNNTNYYYEIMLELLSDDKNYLFIKALIKENKNFLNARSSEKGPIIFEIEDRYIKNLKLELANQKLVHENPTFFYSLLKLFINEDLDLSYGEELLFTSILSDFLKEIEKKGYKEASTIKENIYALFKKRQEVINEKLDANRYQQELQEIAGANCYKRVNLTSEYLESIACKIANFKEEYFLKTEMSPNENEIKNALQIPIYTIHNSENQGITFALENTPYAFTISYDRNYNTYLRIHVMDTTLLNEENTCCKQIIANREETSKYVKKALNFKPMHYYPTITYQIKIEKSKNLGTFKIFESAIKIEKIVKEEELLKYRENEITKAFVGTLKVLAEFYNLEIEKMNSTEIQNVINYILNEKLKSYFMKNNLPALYYTELEMGDKEKENIHNSVRYYLGKIPPSEAHSFVRILMSSKSSRFYGVIPLEESKIELDPRNYIGYMNLLILKCRLHKMFTSLKSRSFVSDLTQIENDINRDSIFLDYFTKRELIRKKKKANE